MDDNNKNKKQLGYNADIQYEEDYSTDYTYQPQTSTSDLGGVEYDDDFMNSIQEDVNDLIQMIPGLPSTMQTAINQVFKPVIKDWNRIKDNKYPKKIPDGNKPIIIIPDPDPIPPGPIPPKPVPPGSTPPGTVPPGSIPPGTVPPGSTPPGTVPPGSIPPGTVPPGSTPPGSILPELKPIPKPEEKERPGYIIPEIGDLPIPDPKEDPYKNFRVDPEEKVPFINDDDLFVPSTNRKVVYETIEKTEQYKLEYTKNMADLIHFYTSRLKGIVSDYYLYLFSSFSVISSAEDMAFLHNQLTPITSQVTDGMRHVMDTALRNEVVGANKMHFCINTFTLEGTLYHLKNLRAIQELRLRYAQIDKQENIESPDSMSNKMLNSMTDMYSAKYDVAYINLYKHLNGSLRITEDCAKTLMSCLKAKETIIRKGGRKK